jgi:hypothetical protein
MGKCLDGSVLLPVIIPYSDNNGANYGLAISFNLIIIILDNGSKAHDRI